MNHAVCATNLATNSTGRKQMKILDIGKWNLQTIESVRHVLEKAEAPCVGFCMLFMDFVDADTILWKFKPMLAFDPHNPPPKEDRDKLEEIFNKWAELAQLIMSGGNKKNA
jgi:hypothetical protein